MKTINIKTPKEGFIDITHYIRTAISEENIKNTLCTIFVPHTTAGITINENADPDVTDDMLRAFDKLIPSLNFKHSEGNSPAHIKSSLVGCSLNLIIKNGSPLLGTWQGVYFCEFDGPRSRKFIISFLKRK